MKRYALVVGVVIAVTIVTVTGHRGKQGLAANELRAAVAGSAGSVSSRSLAQPATVERTSTPSPGSVVPKSEKLVGAWVFTRSVERGEEWPAKPPYRLRRVFDERFFVNEDLLSPESVPSRARYSVDDSSNPKQIDFEYLEGPRKGAVYHGIYEVSGNVLKICTSFDGVVRPSSFESAKGSDITVDFCERQVESPIAANPSIEKPKNHAADAPTAASNAQSGDPEKTMVALEQLRAVGRGTPTAAIQTHMWAAVTGDETALASTITMSEAAHERAASFLANMAPEIRAKSPTPEHLVGLLLSDELLRKVELCQILGSEQQDAQHATVRVRVRTSGTRISVTTFETTLGNGGWQIVIPDEMMDGMLKMLGQKSPAAARGP
jgi:uncharacterized protein (TIGR03067 family)